MDRAPDFIGLGAQRAGTSWIYANLYEHPEICIPMKEIHFFSRERNWSKGYEWYENKFRNCSPDTRAGEFSTSYLMDTNTPQRIHHRYPRVKLIASLRNPINRAYSNYMNDKMAGTVKRETAFAEALREHPEYVEQGRYFSQLQLYLKYFAIDQLLILIYEDSLRDPLGFIQTIYRFIGVNPSFIPSMAFTKINQSRVPRFLWIDRILRRTSEFLRRRGLSSLWWLAKRVSLGSSIRALNTLQPNRETRQYPPSEQELIYEVLESEISGVEELTGRQLKEWRL
jgi:hypothetical protein